MNKYFALAAIAAITVFSSCKKSDDASPSATQPTSWSAKLLGAQNNSNGSFFSPKTGVVYSTGDSATFIANKVDLSFAQIGSGTTTPKFIAPAYRRSEGLSKVTTITRATSFALTSLTKAQFDTVSNDYVSSFTGSAGSIAIQQGKVYSFTNTEGLSGLIYVSTLDAGTGLNGSVNIDVKFEKE